MAYGGSVYILTNKHNTILYVGATTELKSRITQHLEKVYPKSFTAKYNLNKLVHMEHFGFIEEAIQREKYIKGKSRQWKVDLINQHNPNWDDLAPEVLSW